MLLAIITMSGDPRPSYEVIFEGKQKLMKSRLADALKTVI